MLLSLQFVHESRLFLESRLLLESRWFLQIGETIDHRHHYEMHPICSLQRHDRLTNGVTITQALRCQVDGYMADGCFERKIVWLEMPRPWLPVHHGSSRFDSMHFVVVIMILMVAGFDSSRCLISNRMQLLSHAFELLG